MEVYYYVCPICGFTYQVPAYWMSYSPEGVYTMPHMDVTTGKMCSCAELKYREEA